MKEEEFETVHTFIAKMPFKYIVWSWIREHLFCSLGKHRMVMVMTMLFADNSCSSYEYCMDCPKRVE